MKNNCRWLSKYIVVLLGILLVFALTACGGGENADSDSGEGVSQEAISEEGLSSEGESYSDAASSENADGDVDPMAGLGKGRPLESYGQLEHQIVADSSASSNISESASSNTSESNNSGKSANSSDSSNSYEDADVPVVYFTSEINPDGMFAVYEALGVAPEAGDKVGVKLHTGASEETYYLRKDLIGDFVQSLNGTVVECNTALGGSRSNTAYHYQMAEDHGFTEFAPVVILDENGSFELPVDGKHIKADLVGGHFPDYDFYVVLSHFKGHMMGGFGGALKNISIGFASSQGKNRIHRAGESDEAWFPIHGADQDDFQETMAEAGKAVSDYCGDKIIYINVMNNLSVDCDCVPMPRDPAMESIGILASTDPVALDQACVDLVYAAPDGHDLIISIETLHGQHGLDYGEEIGLGSKSYKLVNLDD